MNLKERIKTSAEFCREYKTLQRTAMNQNRLDSASFQNRNIAKTSTQSFGDCKAFVTIANKNLLLENSLKNVTHKPKITVKYAPKSGAQRAREFRARQKAWQNAIKQQNSINGVDFKLPQKNSNAKTPAERSKAYRLRQKLRKKMINEQMATAAASSSSAIFLINNGAVNHESIQ